MSISNITKYALLLAAVLLLVLSCSTKQNETAQPEQDVQTVAEEQIVIDEPEVIIVENNTPAVIDEPVIETVADAKEDEYIRSVSELKDEVITHDVFENDKKTILSIIDDLSQIMQKKDYKKWIKYISPQSLAYWQNTSNLESVSSRLPVKGITLKNLEDYFRLIFIPSRLNVTVDEIRYISSTSVKVVQVKDDQDIICYYFEKIKGEWMLILDTL